MRVFYINTTSDSSNATAKIMLSLSEAVMSSGGEARIYSPKNRQRIMHALLSRITDREGEFSSSATKRLIDDIRSFDPDVVHLSNIHGHFLNYKILFEGLKELGKPIVWSIHDLWPITGHCAVPLDCDCWKNGCDNCHHADYYPKRWFKSQSASNFLKKSAAFNSFPISVVVGSECMKGIFEESLLSNQKCIVIPNGVDIGIFNPKGTPQKDGKIKILGVARNWEIGKNVSFFNQLASTRPDWEITLVGNVGTKTEKGIKLLKYVNSPEQMAEIYSKFDVLVNPSEFESFGMVVFEALACGVPVVANLKTATGEFMTDKVGRVVDFSDIPSVIKAIEEAIKLDKDSCVEFIKDGFTTDIVNSKYLALYLSLINNKSR